MKSKILSAILAFVISFGLWLYVVTVVSPESEDTFYDIPVVMDGESLLSDRGLILLSGADQTVTLKLKGNRSDLSQLNKTNITLLVDLSGITTAGEHSLSYRISYSIDQSGTITVLEQSPKLITVVVAERESKNIPIYIDFTGKVAEGYIVDKQNVTMDSTTIQISGPKDVIDRIDHARVTLDLTDKNATINGLYRPTLCDENGSPVEDVRNVTTSLGEVRVTVRIQRMKEIQLVLNKIFGGGVTEDTCQIELSTETIQVSGSDAALAELNQLILGTVNLAEILESTELTFPIVLPEGVTCLTGETEVTVKVTFPELEIREYTVTNFVAKNVPQGLNAYIIENMMKVHLRGTTELLDTITAEDITVVVDFSNAESGTSEVFAATIEVNTDGVVGAVGKYFVNATVQNVVPAGTEH